MECFYKNAPGYRAEIDLAIAEIYNRIRPFPYAAPLLKSLKEHGYQVYLLSNYGQVPFELSKKHFDFLQYADGGVISYQEKQIKPHLDIYMTLCQKYQIKPAHAVFLDDNPDNIATANMLGFHTILVEKDTDISSRLKDMGVKCS